MGLLGSLASVCSERTYERNKRPVQAGVAFLVSAPKRRKGVEAGFVRPSCPSVFLVLCFRVWVLVSYK